MYYRAVGCVIVKYAVLQCSKVYYSAQCSRVYYSAIWYITVHLGVLQCSRVYYSAVGCIVWQQTLLHCKKSRIRETLNLLTDADSRTDRILEKLHNFFFF